MEMNQFEEYAVLDAQIKQLTSQKDELKVQILEKMIESKEKKVETAIGLFSIANLKSWTYSDKVTKMEEDFKALKATEQSVGTATFEEKPSLRYAEYKL